jgi:REP-associated tyrosine transposase
VPRLPRSALPQNGVYHVTARGVNRCWIFEDDDDRRSFVTVLRTMRSRLHWRCHAYCLMGNHYHLVVEAYLQQISKGLHLLNGFHAQRFNERHGRVGHLFGDRFHTQVIRDEEHLAGACLYVWNNPVRVGLCSAFSEWPWNGRF